MSIYDERRDELEKHEFMMGKSRDRLAVTLDVLTDALVGDLTHAVARPLDRFATPSAQASNLLEGRRPAAPPLPALAPADHWV